MHLPLGFGNNQKYSDMSQYDNIIKPLRLQQIILLAYSARSRYNDFDQNDKGLFVYETKSTLSVHYHRRYPERRKIFDTQPHIRTQDRDRFVKAPDDPHPHHGYSDTGRRSAGLCRYARSAQAEDRTRRIYGQGDQ